MEASFGLSKKDTKTKTEIQHFLVPETKTRFLLYTSVKGILGNK